MTPERMFRSTLGLSILLLAAAAAATAMLLRPSAGPPPPAARTEVTIVPARTTRRPVVLEAGAELRALPGAQARALSPVAGRISEILVTRGQAVAPGQPLALVAPAAGKDSRGGTGRTSRPGERRRGRVEDPAGRGRGEYGSPAGAGQDDAGREPGDGTTAPDHGEGEPRRTVASRAADLPGVESVPGSSYPGSSQGPGSPPPAAVRATRGGVVDDLLVTVDQPVRAGGPVADVLDTSRLAATLQLPTAARGGCLPGMPVIVTAPFYGDEMFDGVVHAVAGTTRPDEQTAPVEILVSNREGRLFVGLPVTAYLRARPPRPELFIPASCLFEHRGEPRVYVVDDRGRVERRRVEVGPEAAGVMRVARGLAEGERVIVDGSLSLSEGEEVNVRSDEGKPAPDELSERQAHWAAGAPPN
jgi:multidrug efflux pump subunit AcrA (membrane-fusion protein)